MTIVDIDELIKRFSMEEQIAIHARSAKLTEARAQARKKENMENIEKIQQILQDDLDKCRSDENMELWQSLREQGITLGAKLPGGETIELKMPE